VQERQDLVRLEEQPVHTGKAITGDELTADKVPERAGAQAKQRCGFTQGEQAGAALRVVLWVRVEWCPHALFSLRR